MSYGHHFLETNFYQALINWTAKTGESNDVILLVSRVFALKSKMATSSIPNIIAGRIFPPMAFPGKNSVARREICANFFKFNLQILDKLWLKSSSASKEINVLERGNDLAGKRSSFLGKLGKIVKFQGPLWKDVQFPSTRKHKIPLYMHSIKVAKAIAVQCWLL